MHGNAETDQKKEAEADAPKLAVARGGTERVDCAFRADDHVLVADADGFWSLAHALSVDFWIHCGFARRLELPPEVRVLEGLGHGDGARAADGDGRATHCVGVRWLEMFNHSRPVLVHVVGMPEPPICAKAPCPHVAARAEGYGQIRDLDRNAHEVNSTRDATPPISSRATRTSARMIEPGVNDLTSALQSMNPIAFIDIDWDRA